MDFISRFVNPIQECQTPGNVMPWQHHPRAYGRTSTWLRHLVQVKQGGRGQQITAEKEEALSGDKVLSFLTCRMAPMNGNYRQGPQTTSITALGN